MLDKEEVTIGKAYAGTDCTLKGRIEDEDGTALSSASVSAIVWTLYETHSGSDTVVAGVSNLSLTPATVIPSAGVLKVPVTAAQNVLVDTTLKAELHRARFKFTHSSGKANIGFIDFEVHKDPKP